MTWQYPVSSGGNSGGAGNILDLQSVTFLEDPGGGVHIPDTALNVATKFHLFDGSPLTFDGATTVKVSLQTMIELGGIGQQVIVLLYDGTTSLGRLIEPYMGDTGGAGPVTYPAHGERIYTPPAGVSTFKFYAYKAFTAAQRAPGIGLIYGGYGNDGSHGADDTDPCVYTVTSMGTIPFATYKKIIP